MPRPSAELLSGGVIGLAERLRLQSAAWIPSLDGYQAGDEEFALYPGCFIYLPVGLPHAFRIRRDEPARFLAMVDPGGLLHLYDEVGIPAAEMRLPGPDGLSLDVEIPRWAEVSPRFGLEVVGPPIPE